MKSPTGRYNYRQAIMTFPTRRWVGDFFYTASRRSTTTSPKSLTDKPHHKQTSRKDKQTSQKHVPDPSQQDWLFLWSRIGIHITLYKPPSPVMCWKEELRTQPWDYHHLNHLDLGVGADLHYFLLGTTPLPWWLGWSSLTVDANWPE